MSGLRNPSPAAPPSAGGLPAKGPDPGSVSGAGSRSALPASPGPKFLTDAQIAQAVRLNALGMDYDAIAEMFGVSFRHVQVRITVARRNARGTALYRPVAEPLGHGGHHAGGPGDG